MKHHTPTKIALLLAFGITAGSAAASTNLVLNGSFEDISANPGIQQLANNTWQVFSSIPGWTTFTGAGIEVRNNVAGVAQHGVQFVELDSHGVNPNSAMQQQLSTIGGQNYTLSFWYSPRPSTASRPSDTNNISVFWNGATLLPTLSGTNNTGSHNWQQYSYTVTGTGSDILRFGALGTQDTYGGSLDNVSVTAVPEPGSLAMILAGLGLMGGVVRRRAS
ncbi:MAG: DUF642 domain-containing protein [Rhodocyclaceae bacterium]|nr:DUF642 domain-containing protein [Rhodocyclaceae bacterium]